MANTLVWSAFADANCTSFNLYRALTGIAISFPNSLVSGDVLTFSATNPTVQNVAIGATDITSVANTINTGAKGIKAAISLSGSVLYIRCTASSKPKLKLMPCTFLTHVGQSPRIITPSVEFNLLTSVTRNTGVFDYTYFDGDGDTSDWYRLTSVSSGTESIPTLPMQALATPESLCVIEGRVIDLQNNPVRGVEVKAAIQPTVGLSSNSGLVTPSITTITDSFGRWSMPLLQCQSVSFRIPAIGYNQVIQVPAQAYALFENLCPNNNYYFSPDGDTTGAPDAGDFDYIG